MRELSVGAILERAQEVLGAVVHPMEPRCETWAELPPQAQQIDFDLEETIENSPLSVLGLEIQSKNSCFLTEQDLWMSYQIRRRQSLVLCIDTSLSMTGEKLALTAVALAVVLLQFPDDPIGIIAFENEAKVLKNLNEGLSVKSLIERFIDVPAQGYTHLEDGMKAALRLIRQGSGLRGRPPSVVLLTDGKYTAGRDPGYLASKFPHLVVLKMGKEKAGMSLCRDLAKRGKGKLKEVVELESLPSVMYSVVKDLLRGRSQ